MIRALARCTMLLVLLSGLVACGQKGPLVLPDKADGQKQEQKKQDAKGSAEKTKAPEAPEPGR